MEPDELLAAHRRLWQAAFSPLAVARRVGRALLRLRPGALLLVLAMNGFYGLKALRGNRPLDARRLQVSVAVGPLLGQPVEAATPGIAVRTGSVEGAGVRLG
jgi:hypothetical protein